jgi:hypothetical protein
MAVERGWMPNDQVCATAIARETGQTVVDARKRIWLVDSEVRPRLPWWTFAKSITHLVIANTVDKSTRIASFAI